MLTMLAKPIAVTTIAALSTMFLPQLTGCAKKKNPIHPKRSHRLNPLPGM